MALNIAPATGQQTATQNPQTVPTQTIGGASATSGGVQPGTSLNLLNGSQGESLGTAALTTVNINPGAQTQTGTQAASSQAAKPAHHIGAAWFIVPVALCLVAAAMFWGMAHSAKSTTN